MLALFGGRMPTENSTPESPKPAKTAKTKLPTLSPQDVQAIVAIISSSPCPGGIPQAQFNASLIQRFLATQPPKGS